MEVIDERYIRSITDNVSPLIKKRQYYAFVEETMREFGMILSGKPIPQPVKHFDNAMLSLILSGLLVFAAILISAKFRKRGKKNILKDVRITCRMSNAKTDLVGRTGRLP